MAKVVRAYESTDGNIYPTSEEAVAADKVVLIADLSDAFESFNIDEDHPGEALQLLLRKLIDNSLTTKKKMEAMIDSIGSTLEKE